MRSNSRKNFVNPSPLEYISMQRLKLIIHYITAHDYQTWVKLQRLIINCQAQTYIFLKEEFFLCFPLISKEGPDDDDTIAQVYILCFIILERLVVNMTLHRVYILCFSLLCHMHQNVFEGGVYVLYFITLERLVVDRTIDKVYDLCFILLCHLH